MRPVYACRFCGRSYEGRGIYADHGLSKYNLEQHEAACLGQQHRRAQVVSRAQARAARAYRKVQERVARRTGGTPPSEGQLGFPGFEGVPSIVR